MGTLSSAVDLLVDLRAEEDALLGWLSNLNVLSNVRRGTALVANGGIDRKCSVNISAGLIEFNRLPSILSGLTDPWSILNSGHVGAW